VQHTSGFTHFAARREEKRAKDQLVEDYRHALAVVAEDERHAGEMREYTQALLARPLLSGATLSAEARAKLHDIATVDQLRQLAADQDAQVQRGLTIMDRKWLADLRDGPPWEAPQRRRVPAKATVLKMLERQRQRVPARATVLKSGVIRGGGAAVRAREVLSVLKSDEALLDAVVGGVTHENLPEGVILSKRVDYLADLDGNMLRVELSGTDASAVANVRSMIEGVLT
jgi:hypothetical protein